MKSNNEIIDLLQITIIFNSLIAVLFVSCFIGGCSSNPREQREKVKAENPELFRSVSEILFREDPIGINFGDNTDEYEPEVGTILPRLNECNSVLDVQLVIHEEFVHWFGLEIAGDKEKYIKIAEEIWKEWQMQLNKKGGD